MRKICQEKQGKLKKLKGCQNLRALCACLRAYGKSIYRFLNLSPPHQSGISFSSRTKRREPRSVSMQILPASAKSCIINSRQAPHGIPALPSGITATIFISTERKRVEKSQIFFIIVISSAVARARSAQPCQGSRLRETADKSQLN